jgi:hypothetical protein
MEPELGTVKTFIMEANKTKKRNCQAAGRNKSTRGM